MEKNAKPTILVKKEKHLIGSKEWCSLPDLGLKEIRAKIDTGAKTSSLHAQPLDVFIEDEIKYIRFKILPHQKEDYFSKICVAKLVDYRFVTSSSGHREKRYVIETELIIGNIKFLAEITLTDRALLNYPMLIGRTALKHLFLIDPSKSYMQKKPKI